MSQPDNQPLKRTPLYETHVAAGAKMVPFGGWDMPVHYGSQLEEHHATRRDCGLFDVSHMGEAEITGPRALDLVQEITTNDYARLKDGEEAYTVMCRDNGGIVDDLIITRFSAERWFFVVNASTYPKDMAFMGEVAAKLGLGDAARLEPCTEKWGMIAVQGPRWKEVLRPVLGEGSWESIRPFTALETSWSGAPMIISATGYTGEPGVELLIPPAQSAPLWNALAAAGGRPCGLAARDTLRLEKGYCLSGQDFTEANNPLEAGLGWVVKLAKPSFSGKAAIEKIKAAGPARRLMGLLPEGRRIPRHENPILAGGRPVGEITSGGFSPSLNCPIAMGYIEPAHAGPGSEVEIALGGSSVIKAKVVKPPFYPAA